jgi:hypothetical protein
LLGALKFIFGLFFGVVSLFAYCLYYSLAGCCWTVLQQGPPSRTRTLPLTTQCASFVHHIVSFGEQFVVSNHRSSGARNFTGAKFTSKV